MAAKQYVVSIKKFAEAMFETDIVFAERVRKFEKSFGTVDSDTLAVLAQATYFCWFECEYERDYVEVCRAIGTGKPTSLFLCRQVTPERWLQMNTYVIAVQRWLGVNFALPGDIDSNKLSK